MISVRDLRGESFDPYRVVPRAELNIEHAVAQVAPILVEVRDGGESALLDLSERFDGIRPQTLRVPREVMQDALTELQPEVRAALEESISRARRVHETQRRESSECLLADGARVTTRWVPVQRVGLYVPGGKAVYPSSVVMNVVPALVAGVQSLAIASPPQKDHGGYPHPTILAAAMLLGVDEVYAVGGAQAIAMFAYGAQSAAGNVVCRRVDMVTGPGNIWVAAAKRALRGDIGIDSEAGPTEIGILADDTANPVWLAADLISQAEHDPMAAAVLVTSSDKLASCVVEELERQVPLATHADRIRQSLSGPQSGVFIVDDLDGALELVNAYGAEHLEIHTENAAEVATRVTSAGAIFVGPYSPVALGDYSAGSNHVLPTGGSARFSSGLSVQTFLRGVQIIDYSKAGLAAVQMHVQVLANEEGLPAHGEAVKVRFDDERSRSTLR